MARVQLSNKFAGIEVITQLRKVEAKVVTLVLFTKRPAGIEAMPLVLPTPATTLKVLANVVTFLQLSNKPLGIVRDDDAPKLTWKVLANVVTDLQLSKNPLGTEVIALQFKNAEAKVVETLCPNNNGSAPDILVQPLNIRE